MGIALQWGLRKLRENVM